MALVSAMLILIGAVCPLVVFRMLAFVDPGTSSGAALRTSFAASGGVAALIGGKGGGAEAGSSAGVRQDDAGRSMGESDADSQTQGRFAQSMSRLSGGITSVGAAMAAGVSGSSAIGADVLGAAGVGHQAPYFGQGDISGGSPAGSRSGVGSRQGADEWPDNPGQGDIDGGPGVLPPTPPPMQPPPVQPLPPPALTGASQGPPGGPGGAGLGAGAGAAETIPVVPL
jgi:type IV secretion system protein TrbL